MDYTTYYAISSYYMYDYLYVLLASADGQQIEYVFAIVGGLFSYSEE